MDSFLKKHSSKTNHTHTKIGCEKLGIYGGSYCIPSDQMDEFYKLYKKHIKDKEAYFTEKQLEEGPLLIDLDFRYDPDIEERIHNLNDIVNMVQSLFMLLSEIKVPNDKTLSCYIFEKPNVNMSSEEVTKDGIHIIMDVKMDFNEKIIFRNKLLKSICELFQHIPITNTWDQVVDEGVMKGSVNWQLYGSRKPGNEAYELKYVFQGIFQSDWTIEQINFDEDYIYEHFVKFTARNSDLIVLKQNKQIKEEYDKIKTQRDNGKLRKCKVKLITSYQNPYYEINSSDMLESYVDKLLEECPLDQQHIKDAHNYTMTLDESYYGEGSYNKWIKVGMALKNTSEQLFVTWLKFSSQSSSFDWTNVMDLYDTWNKFNDGDLSHRSIIYWSKESNVEKYNEVFKQSIQKYIHYTFYNILDFDIAVLLHAIYKDNYVCVNVKSGIWYEFDQNRWIENDSGTSLRSKLSTDVYNLYFKYAKQLTHGKDTEEAKEIASKFSKISKVLKTTNDKKNIMKESLDLFYDCNFYNRLDTNPYLIGCKNCIVDIKNKEHRKGIHHDYIHKTTNIDYMPLDYYREVSPNIIEELNTFMYQLFPEEELREYMWEHLASTLIGNNNNQTFNIYLGVGANGKSILVDLMGKILGDYKGTVPSTLITQKRTSIGSTSSEVYQLIGKRYAVMQELSKGDVINEGVMKEITGGDPIQCRALFKDSITFIPQFKLVVCTNVLFDVKSNDDGTWRRIRVCEFKSKFTEKPYEEKEFPKKDYPYQFKIDKNLHQKFKFWAPVFFSMLVEKAFQTQGKVTDRPCVLDPTSNYRKAQDILLDFCNSCIVEEPGEFGNLKIGVINSLFTDWFKNEYGKSNTINTKELREYLEKKYGKYNTKTGWSNIHIKEEDI
jgi:P4 family phage/plasmid primase-like protien